MFLFFLPSLSTGPSMQPTLPSNCTVFVRPVYNRSALKVGDIVDISPDGINDDRVNTNIRKRIVALPGEVVPENDAYSNPYAGVKLADDEVFVVGDNYANSFDSRIFGPVKISGIKFVVVAALKCPAVFGMLLVLLVVALPILIAGLAEEKKQNKPRTNSFGTRLKSFASNLKDKITSSVRSTLH